MPAGVQLTGGPGRFAGSRCDGKLAGSGGHCVGCCAWRAKHEAMWWVHRTGLCLCAVWIIPWRASRRYVHTSTQPTNRSSLLSCRGHCRALLCIANSCAIPVPMSSAC